VSITRPPRRVMMVFGFFLVAIAHSLVAMSSSRDPIIATCESSHLGNATGRLADDSGRLTARYGRSFVDSSDLGASTSQLAVGGGHLFTPTGDLAEGAN